MRTADQARTIVDRLLSAPPTRLDEQLAAVLFAVTFCAGGLVMFAARRVRRIVAVAGSPVGAVTRSGSRTG